MLIAKKIISFWTRSIQRQLVLGIAVVHAVMMSIFVFDLVERQRKFLSEQSVAQAESLADTLAANSSSWLLANDVIGLEEIIQSQSRYPGLRYAILINPQGKVLAHTDNKFIGQFISDKKSQALLKSSPKRQILAANPTIIDVASPIMANDQLIGWARVAVSQEQITTGLQVILRDGVIYTIIAIVVGIIFAFFMAKGLTSGLRMILETSRRVREGDTNVRSGLERSDELGMLSVQINRMLDALEESRARLADSEERFDLAMRGANDGLWDWDVKSNKTYYSDRWKAMLGYEAHEIDSTEQEWSIRVHPDDKEQVKLDIRDHLEGKIPLYENIHRIRHKDQSWRWHLERGIAVRDEHGVPYRMVGTSTDITDKKLAEQALFHEKERALVTLNSIGDAVITTDNSGVVTFLNPIAEELTGWSNDEATGKNLEEVFHIINEKTRKRMDNPVSNCLNQGKVVALANDTLLINRSGNEIAIEDSAAPIRNSDNEIIGVVMVFHDVSAARELVEKMTWQATHDSLTGLVNRREFERRLGDLIVIAKKRHKSHILMYIDLDQFKIVNDTCGHTAGDEMLRQLSFILQDQVRESDTLARLGGDEFGILLAGCSLDNAKTIADNIRQTIKEFRFSWEEKTFEIGASIGVVSISEDTENVSNALSAADVACYAAKDLGRNRVYYYEANDADLQKRHGEMEWVSKINAAFANDQFKLYYQIIQPVKDTEDNSLHFEVLLRMLDENNSIIPPAAFIPAAERYNLMSVIDRWVIRNTCKFIDEYQSRGSLIPLDTVSINLSGNSFSENDFEQYVFEQLNEFNVPAKLLCFEVTETAAIANLTQAVQFIRKMKQIGCRFSLDDFGSGLSSFAYLKNLPVDFLKIDGNFVKDMANDQIDFAMVRSINEIGQVMGLGTIAEYVEDEVSLNMLREIGVNYAQGYGIAKPSPIEELLSPPVKLRAIK